MMVQTKDLFPRGSGYSFFETNSYPVAVFFFGVVGTKGDAGEIATASDLVQVSLGTRGKRLVAAIRFLLEMNENVMVANVSTPF